MKIIKSCEKCLYDKQYHRVKEYSKDKQLIYLNKVQELLDDREDNDSAPYMIYKFNNLFEQLFGKKESYKEIKLKYNNLVLNIKDDLYNNIINSDDPLRTALIYSRIGNYIDFGAMNHVDKETFIKKERKTHYPLGGGI